MSHEETSHRRQAVSTIHDIVNAMRAIAAGRIQGAQHALENASRYQEIIRRAIAALPADELPTVTPPSSTTTLIVMTSEQPLCGGYNQNVLAFAERRVHELQALGPVTLIAVGQRGLRQMAGHALLPDVVEPAATSLSGLRDTVKRLARVVTDRFMAGSLGTLRVLFNRYVAVTEQVPSEETLFPIRLDDLLHVEPPPRGRFHHYLPTDQLLVGMIGEYLFIDLYRIAADAFASEQASRLVAMDGATRNTERLLQSLTDLQQRERQDEITREILELIGARLAMS